MKPNLVLGLGNPLMGDDGIGCVLAERLASDPRLPADTEVLVAGSDLLRFAGRMEYRQRVILIEMPGYHGRNKTFWFFNYEGFRQRQANTATGTYPSAAQMAGNLADDSTGTGILPTSSPLCAANPGSFKCHDVIDPLSGQAFAGNIIPTSRLDPIVQKQLPYQPKPNVSVAPNSPSFPAYNTIGFPKRVNDFDQYNVRLDHHFGSSDILYGTFSNSDETLLSPGIASSGRRRLPANRSAVHGHL